MRSFVYFTRPNVSVRHVRGLLEGLEQLGAEPFDEIAIKVIHENDGWSVPAGHAVATGQPLPPGVLHDGNLPAEGLLFVGE